MTPGASNTVSEGGQNQTPIRGQYLTPIDSPWLTVKEAADRARCGPKLIYREVKARRLKAARLGGRRELRFLAEWIDEWLTTSCTIEPIR